MSDRTYYVYVYIDPRNHEEFYYGKGKGSRKYDHLSDRSDSGKVQRIAEIKKDGLLPIIRVVAAGLMESEAHIIETALIWKLGKGLTNRAAGKFVSLFRPHNTLHREVPKFDFHNGIYSFNVGEGPHRNWDDCLRLGFISSGQGVKWRNQILEFAEGDVVIAYLKSHGFVGIGKVSARAVPYADYRHAGRLLHEHHLKAPRMRENSEDPDKSEYVASTAWIAAVPRDDAKWKSRSGLFTTQLIRSSLERQPTTLAFIEKEFGVDVRALAA